MLMEQLESPMPYQYNTLMRIDICQATVGRITNKNYSSYYSLKSVLSYTEWTNQNYIV